jgi:hypothetical protein
LKPYIVVEILRDLPLREVAAGDRVQHRLVREDPAIATSIFCACDGFPMMYVCPGRGRTRVPRSAGASSSSSSVSGDEAEVEVGLEPLERVVHR